MNNKTVSNLGFIGVSLLIFTLIFGGLLIENYDITNQFISESYAIDTKHGVSLRLLGYIPSGIIIALFCFLGKKYLDSKLVVKIGFYGIGIFYGLGRSSCGKFSWCVRKYNARGNPQLIIQKKYYIDNEPVKKKSKKKKKKRKIQEINKDLIGITRKRSSKKPKSFTPNFEKPSSSSYY